MDGRHGMTSTEIIAMLVWYAFIAAGIALIYLLSTMLSDAATLSMTGTCTGQGFTNITVEADLLLASINQTVNGTTWQIWGAPA
jgi:hypothetical protein